MNKIIILGCGYIGTNLANFIYSNFHEEVYVIGIANEYNEFLNKNIKFVPLRTEQICEDNKELFGNSIVIDAVGNTNATNSSFNSSNLLLQNCSNKIELIHKLANLKVKKYIFLSSGGTIYNDSNIPHREEEACDPKSIYALEKMIIEKFLRIFQAENQCLDYLILRLSNPYGGIISKHKSQGIIDVAISKINNDEDLNFFGDLENIRDYIFIDNLSEYIYKIAISDYKNDIYNIGTGIGHSVNEVLEFIEKIFKKTTRLVNQKSSTINIKCNTLNVEKIKKCVDIKNIYTLGEGIKKIKEGL